MLYLLDLLFPPREEERLVRSLSEDELLTLLSPRLMPETTPATTALLPFGDARVRALLHEAKYHASRRAHRLLGAVLREYLHERDTLGGRVAIVPIPLSTARLRTRGYNQVEAVLTRIHKHSPEIGTLAPHLLLRTRDTGSQVGLTREARMKNLRGAFRATEMFDPDTIYMIVDDVITTGATLTAAIDALKSSGAVTIIPLALAR